MFGNLLLDPLDGSISDQLEAALGGASLKPSSFLGVQVRDGCGLPRELKP